MCLDISSLKGLQLGVFPIGHIVLLLPWIQTSLSQKPEIVIN